MDQLANREPYWQCALYGIAVIGIIISSNNGTPTAVPMIGVESNCQSWCGELGQTCTTPTGAHAFMQPTLYATTSDKFTPPLKGSNAKGWRGPQRHDKN